MVDMHSSGLLRTIDVVFVVKLDIYFMGIASLWCPVTWMMFPSLWNSVFMLCIRPVLMVQKTHTMLSKTRRGRRCLNWRKIGGWVGEFNRLNGQHEVSSSSLYSTFNTNSILDRNSIHRSLRVSRTIVIFLCFVLDYIACIYIPYTPCWNSNSLSICFYSYRRI